MKPLFPLAIFLALLALSCTEEVLVEKTVYDTVYLNRPLEKVEYTHYDTVTVYETKLDTVYLTETVLQVDTVYLTETDYRIDTVYVEQIVERIDTVYVPVVDTLEYSNTITVPWFWRPHVDNFLEAVEECNFPLFARDVVIDTTWREPVNLWGGDTIMYAYSYMVGGTTGYDGYWYINIDIAKKDCAEAIIYRELMHRLAGWPYAGDWRLWTHFIGDTDIIGYDPDKDQIMYQNWPGCLEGMDSYYRARYLTDLILCLN